MSEYQVFVHKPGTSTVICEFQFKTYEEMMKFITTSGELVESAWKTVAGCIPFQIL